MEAKKKKLVYLDEEADTALWNIYKTKKEQGETVTYSSIIAQAILNLYKQEYAE